MKSSIAFKSAVVGAGLLASFLITTVSGCDTAGEEDRRSRFVATFHGSVSSAMNGEAIYGNYKGDLMLDLFSNFGIRLSDSDVRGDGVYFTRRDTSVLEVGTYPLLDMVSGDIDRAGPHRLWAFASVNDGFLYSRGGELVIEAAEDGILVGRFSFSAAALIDTSPDFSREA